MILIVSASLTFLLVVTLAVVVVFGGGGDDLDREVVVGMQRQRHADARQIDRIGAITGEGDDQLAVHEGHRAAGDLLAFGQGIARAVDSQTVTQTAAIWQRGFLAHDYGVDLSGVTNTDSAGLALLLEWQAEYRGHSGNGRLMAIQEPPQALMKIARLCGAEEYLAGAAGPLAEGEAEAQDERG